MGDFLTICAWCAQEQEEVSSTVCSKETEKRVITHSIGGSCFIELERYESVSTQD